MDADPLPLELQGVPQHVLLAYVERCLERVASSTVLAQRLRLPSNQVQSAIQSTFEDLYRPEARAGPGSQLKLVFRHDCQNLTCLNPRCLLCSQNPNKRCPDGVNFNSKYLEKNALKSKCGANIRLEVVNATTGAPAQQQRLEDVCLELSVLDGKKFASLHETGEDVASCELFLTPKGKEVLSPGRLGVQTNEFRVRMPLTARGHAVLGTDLQVQVSSEAMLGGQKSPYKLLVRAVNQHSGLEVPFISYVVSEDFVVATARVAKAVKAEIPCVDDDVGKLEDIGDKTKKKLADVQAAAEAAGVFDLLFPARSITTVGQFKQLVELSNTDPRFCEKLKQNLIPNKAREHVALAVDNDKRLRMWYPEPNNKDGGLLFRSVRARVDLDHPDVLVQHKVGADGSSQPDLTPCGQVMGEQKEVLRRLVGQAKEDWLLPDHPNWSVRDMDSSHFLDSMQPGQSMYDAPTRTGHVEMGRGVALTAPSAPQQGPAGLQYGSGQLGPGLGSALREGSGHMGQPPNLHRNSGQSSSGSGLLHASGGLGSGPLDRRLGGGQHLLHSTSPQLGSGHSSGGARLGSGGQSSAAGHLGSGQLSGQLSGQSLGMLLDQGSGQLGSSGQALGQQHSATYGAHGPGWSGSAHLGSNPPSTGPAGSLRPDSPYGSVAAAQLRSKSPFAHPLDQHPPEFRSSNDYGQSNGGYNQFDTASNKEPTSNAFDGFRTSPHSPFLDFHPEQNSMADIFPQQAAASPQPATSQASSLGLNHHWSTGSVTAGGPSFFQRPSQSLEVHPGGPGSSHGSASLGSGAQAAGAALNSPTLSQNSVPTPLAGPRPGYQAPLEAGSLAQLLESPKDGPVFDRLGSGLMEPGAKRARKPAELQSGLAGVMSDPARVGPEIMQQQQLLRQRTNSNPAAASMPPPTHYPSMLPQHSDSAQLQAPSQAMPAGTAAFASLDQQPAVGQRAGSSGLNGLPDQFAGLPTVPEGFLDAPNPSDSRFLFSQQSLQFLDTRTPLASEAQVSQPQSGPGAMPPLPSYLNDRSDPMRHVRFNAEALEDPYEGLAPEEPALDTARPSVQSSGELIPNVDPARAKWAQKDRWSSGNIFASFGSRVRRQLGASGKSDGLESMKDIDDALPDCDWEDMSVGHSFKSRDGRPDDDEHPNPEHL